MKKLISRQSVKVELNISPLKKKVALNSILGGGRKTTRNPLHTINPIIARVLRPVKRIVYKYSGTLSEIPNVVIYKHKYK